MPVIILQGIFGTIPSAAQSFTTMYLQWALEELGSDARLWHLKTLARSQCQRSVIQDGVKFYSGVGSPVRWTVLAGVLRSKLAGLGWRHGWRRLGGLALQHHLCRRSKTSQQDCVANAETCPVGVVADHVLMLLSHPESYAMDLRLIDAHETVHRWEILGASLGYYIWNLPGFRLLDVLYSGWPLFALLRALRPRLARLVNFRGAPHATPEALDLAARLKKAKEARDTGQRRLSRLDADYISAVSLCQILESHGMDKWTGCPLTSAHEALETALATASDLKEMERHVERAEEHLRKFLWWLQAPGEAWKAPGARIATLMFIAADCMLPLLARLQKRLEHLVELKRPTPAGAMCPALELPEQGVLMAEAAYAADFHQAMEEMVPEFGSRPVDLETSANQSSKEAWVTFLWGGTSAGAKRAAELNSEVIRTMVHSVRKWETHRRAFLVLAVGSLPARVAAELRRADLKVRTIRENETIPIWRAEFVKKPEGLGDWFTDRNLTRTFAQLAAWALKDFERVVVLDADTLVVQRCEELFRLPMHFAASLETHRDQETFSRLQSLGRTYLVNAGVMVIRPNLHLLRRIRRGADFPAFRYHAEKIGVMGEATFQSLIDTYLTTENYWRLGVVLWDQAGRFDGCRAGLGSSQVVSAWMAHGRVHCLLPIDYNFCADFPHVFFASYDYLAQAKADAPKQPARHLRAELIRKTLRLYWSSGLLRGLPKILHFPGHLRKPWQRWLPAARSPWDEAWWSAHAEMCRSSPTPCRLRC
ncbi:unnamed protein product [Effrenium voratum]|uniref:Uncharacterized protein n=1 Tax=Effrenium voratum TaxID=2562239 RepID=A0AA36J9G4_9DINO|nr:unnamed protein product [Effrenium voratum]